MMNVKIRVLWSVILAGIAVSAFSAQPKPNFLIILVDDMGYSDIEVYGGEVKTPNLKRLAEGGMKFTQMYNTSKCYPTRAALMTGVYFQRTDREFPNTATMGEVLRPAGYRTLWTGKHHAKFNPTTRGFDRHFGLLAGCCNYWNPGSAARPGECAPAHKLQSRWSLDGREVDDFIPEDKDFYTTDVFTDYALKWLEEYKKEDKPFLLYVPYNAPHWPLHAWPEDIAKYKGVYDGGYEAVRAARYKRQVAMGLVAPKTTPLSTPESKETWNELDAAEQKKEAMRMEIHAAMIDRVDQNIGRLLKKLEELGKLENTLILFLIDNGASAERPNIKNKDPNAPMGSVSSYESIGKNWAVVCETPLRKWKATSHEGGICTPMIAHWPKVIKPRKEWYREPAHLVDVMATAVDITGANYPGESKEQNIPAMDGVSLLPAFKGGTHQRDKPLFFQFGSGFAVRKGKWKLVRAGATAKWELYDMSTARTEMTDLSGKMSELVAQLDAEWNTWWTECTGKKFEAKQKSTNKKSKGMKKKKTKG